MMNDPATPGRQNGDGRASTADYRGRTDVPPDYGSHADPRSDHASQRLLEDQRYSNSVSSQLRGLAHDIPTLFNKEIALAKAELREAMTAAKAGFVSMSMGAGLASAGLLIVLFSAVYGLGQVIDLWLAALIVGVASLVVGFLLIKGGQKKIEPAAFKPERTIESWQRDEAAVERKFKEETHQ